MVPGPESKSRCLVPICIRTEHELLCSEGTQVPEPRIVTMIPDLSNVIANTFSTLVIIFVHYVARSFCETIKLPKEMPKKMPKMPKVEVFYLFK